MPCEEALRLASSPLYYPPSRPELASCLAVARHRYHSVVQASRRVARFRAEARGEAHGGLIARCASTSSSPSRSLPKPPLPRTLSGRPQQPPFSLLKNSVWPYTLVLSKYFLHSCSSAIVSTHPMGDFPCPLSVVFAAMIGLVAALFGVWFGRTARRPHRGSALGTFTAGILVGIALLSVLPGAVDDLAMHGWHTGTVLLLCVGFMGCIFVVENVCLEHEHLATNAPADYGAAQMVAASCAAEADATAVHNQTQTRSWRGIVMATADVELACMECEEPGEEPEGEACSSLTCKTCATTTSTTTGPQPPQPPQPPQRALVEVSSSSASADKRCEGEGAAAEPAGRTGRAHRLSSQHGRGWGRLADETPSDKLPRCAGFRGLQASSAASLGAAHSLDITPSPPHTAITLARWQPELSAMRVLVETTAR